MQSQGQSTLTEDEAEALEDAVAFEGVSKYPARVKCALLGWMAMKSAVAEAIGDTAEAMGNSLPGDSDSERSVQP